ncbi:conserved hypothetical protein [Ferroglobus placidus DSM 10642]|uniref:Uncharacterized protein n=1 Tax=Ferroglobus placidus (strain DSM 10642 / AEDII12DO) TaxID=589924 RepID=D3RZA6_FERPA|nr:hypothetical protein [Ferroglobus placidus]ADC65819.1 conserved hypothetical protein [Ferroglobus placidus DSM 10642]
MILRIIVAILLIMALSTTLYTWLNDQNPLPKSVGKDGKIMLKTKLPEIKVAAVYRIVDVERVLIPPKKNLREVKFVPSESEAINILNSYLNISGYNGLVLKNVETVTTKTINTKTGEITKVKPEFVSIVYGREINGTPVIGPAADGIVAAVADNEVIYLSKLWRKVEKIGEKRIITAENALKKLEYGELLNNPLYTGTKLEIRDVKLAYYAENENQKYYKVVWLFKCVDEYGNWVDIIVDASS